MSIEIGEIQEAKDKEMEIPSPDKSRNSVEFDKALDAERKRITQDIRGDDQFKARADELADKCSPEQIRELLGKLQDPEAVAAKYKDAVHGDHPEWSKEERADHIEVAKNDWEGDVAAREVYGMALSRENDSLDETVSFDKISEFSEHDDEIRQDKLQRTDEIKPDIDSDVARVRLREHMIGEMEKRGETDFGHWSELSGDQRVESLQRLADAESSIHIGKVDSPTVERDSKHTLGDGVLGATTRDGRSIRISEDVVDCDDPRVAANVLYHESRHTDQIVEANDEDAEFGSKERIERNELGMEHSKYQEKYADTFIEADARAAGMRGAEALERVIDGKQSGLKGILESSSNGGTGLGDVEPVVPKPDSGMEPNDYVSVSRAEAPLRKAWHDRQNGL